MIFEALSVLLALFLLGFIGLGPALWLVPAQPNAILRAAALAPALGFALLEILGLALVRYLAPVEQWAVPFTVAAVLLSAGLAYAWWRRSRASLSWQIRPRDLGLPVVAFAVCYLVLVSPLLAYGIQYTIFRSNSSDAFTYISLAETMRRVPWNVLVRAMNFSSDNTAALVQLATLSPTALFSARYVGFPLQLNNMVSLAWYSQVLGIPVYAAYYPFHLLALSSSFLLAVVLGALLKLPPPIKYLAALAVALGFWARFVLETDASYEINSMRLLLLAAAAWSMQEEFQPNVLWARTRLLLAIALAALALTYQVLLPLVLVAFLLYYGVQLLRRDRAPWALLYHSITAGLIVLLIVVTGQLDLYYLNAIYLLTNLNGLKNFEPTVLKVWQANGLGGIWGLGLATLGPAPRALIRVPLTVLATSLALVLTVMTLFAGWFSFLRTRRPTCQIVLALLFAGLLIFGSSILLGNPRAAGKAFTYVYPYLVLTVALAPGLMPAYPLWLARAAAGALVLWLALQVAIGAWLPFGRAFQSVFSSTPRAENYDLSPITRILDTNPPQLVLVAIPRSTSWEFPFYVTFVLERFPTYFQSGLVVDNNTKIRNFWTGALTAAPDYAVIAKSDDYIGVQGLGTRVAETRDLVLYRLTRADVNALSKQSTAMQAADASKPPFQPSIPLLFQSP